MSFAPALVVGATALAGLLLGSFANVVIHRVPERASVVRPPSACPSCATRLRWWQNIPVASFLILRGRCGFCDARISRRYPTVEIGTAVLFALTALWRWPEPDLPVYLALAFVAVVLAAIDLAHRRLPNLIVLPAIAGALAGFGVVAVVTGDTAGLLRAAGGGAALFAAYLLLALLWPSGMGMGDVKLAALLGLALGWVGWGAWAIGAFAAFLVGSLVGVAVLLIRGGGRRTMIPFGPSMLVGAAIGLVVGEPIAAWYLALLGL